MNVLIIEDEAPAARKLSKLIEQIDPSIQILDIIQSVRDGIKWFINNKEPDLIFADIQLSDNLSFNIFKELKISTPIIFTTAFDEYAIKAFDYYSIDYLLKPIKKDSLVKAITKYNNLHLVPKYPDFEKILLKFQKDHYKGRFLIYDKDSLIPVECDDIAYIYSEDGASFIVTHNNKSYQIRDSLDTLENQLQPRRFFRANRQYIISIQSIDKVYQHFNQKLKVVIKPSHTHKEIIISKLKAPVFKEWLNS